MQFPNHIRRPIRRGSITIVVVAFLALFAVVGITFAIAATSSNDNSRVFRQSNYGGQTGVAPRDGATSEPESPPNPDNVFSKALSYVIYDAPNDETGLYVALRGHSLARTMYGYRPNNNTNAVPFAGYGRMTAGMNQANLPPALSAYLFGVPGQNDTTLLSYQRFPEPAANNFVRDPESIGSGGGVRPNPNTAPSGFGYISAAANYTYPDQNNVYLAAVDALTGRVLIPSFHRPWNYGNSATPANPANGVIINLPPNGAAQPVNGNPWLTRRGKYQILRPRPVDNIWPINSGRSEFPYPKVNADGSIGDVENLENKALGQQYDSLWMDLDLPVQTWRGRRYKPLVAFLISDLDGRINLNVAGNIRAPNGTAFAQSANQGWGPWEMDLARVFGNNIGDSNRLFRGAGSAVDANSGRYGGSAATSTPAFGGFQNPNNPPGPKQKRYPTFSGEPLDNNPVSGSLANFYARVDLDGASNNGVTDPRMQNPTGLRTSPIYGPAPTGPIATGGIPTNNRYREGFNPERWNHMMFFNPYLFTEKGPSSIYSNTPRAFGPEELGWVNRRFQDFNSSQYSRGDLANLATATFGGALSTGVLYTQSMQQTGRFYDDRLTNARFMTTPISNDLDRPGATPWLSAPANYQLAGVTGAFALSPTALTAQNFNPLSANSPDFDPVEIEALAATLGAVDINRKLGDIRANPNLPYSEGNTLAIGDPRYIRAIRDRQELARDILERLRAAVGTVATAGANTPQFHAQRWLAQLAVNIVDYIDNDDAMTPFVWNPTNPVTAQFFGDPGYAGNFVNGIFENRVVYGTELPRLVLNETYQIFENDANDNGNVPGSNGPFSPPPGLGMGAHDQTAKRDYVVKTWFELHNPLSPENQNDVGHMSNGGAALLTSGTGRQIYRIVVARRIDSMRDPQNVLGAPNLQANGVNVYNPGQDGNYAPAAAFGANVGANRYIRTVVTFQNNVAVQPNFVNPGPMAGPNNSYLLVCPPAVNNRIDQPGPPHTWPLAADNALAPLPMPGGNPVGVTNIAVGINGAYRVGNGTQSPNESNFLNAADPNIGYPWAPKFMLQRLVNPYEPPSMTNPYITVDYNDFRSIVANQSLISRYILATPGSYLGNNARAAMLPNHRSFGRNEPRDGRVASLAAQAGGGAGLPQHNLGRANSNLITTTGSPSLRWLVHLDRSPTSAAELVHASAFKPHELTQQFFPIAPAANTRMSHTADWFNNATRLYRAFDLLQVKSRIHGMGMGGRIPGKVNINTVYNKAIFDAITSREIVSGGTAPNRAGMRYTATDVDTSWGRLNGRRWTTTGGISTPFNGADRPFYGTMNQHLPTPISGIDRTIYAPGIFGSASGNNQIDGGYQNQEMLRFVANNLTTRSNTFAIWATVGYFEVKNEGPYTLNNRPILGRELGSQDGTNVRHKFFAVVDRTNLSIDTANNFKQGQRPVWFSYEPNTPVSGVGSNEPTPSSAAPSVQVQLAVPASGMDTSNRLFGVYDGYRWTLGVGSRLRIDSPGKEFTIPANRPVPQVPQGAGFEDVQVTDVTYDAANRRGLVTVTITRRHARGAAVQLLTSRPGNPGPQPQFNPNSDLYRGVVPVYERIK